MSTKIIAILLGLVLFIPGFTQAQDSLAGDAPPPPIPVNLQIDIPGFDPGNQIVYGPIPVGCDETTPDTCVCGTAMVCVQTLDNYLNAIYRWSIGAGTIFAIVLIMLGGVQWMLGSAIGTIDKAKKRVQNASLGLLFLLTTSMILTFINPNITTLASIELPVVAAAFISSENTHLDYTDDGTGNPTETNAVPQNILDIAAANQSADHPKNMQWFNQRNYNVPYGGCGTIKSAGCGPTSVAMITRHFGLQVDPPDVADAFADQGSRACPTLEDGSLNCDACQGTSWSAYSSSSDFFVLNGFKGRQYAPSQRNEILEILAEGKPMLASMGCSRFTSNGHFIVLAGMNANGTIPVKDPNSSARTATNVEELWSTIPYADDRRSCAGRTNNLTALKATWLIEPISTSSPAVLNSGLDSL